jgi:hypothetical protein
LIADKVGAQYEAIKQSPMFARIIFLGGYDAESDTSPILTILWGGEEGPCAAESVVENKKLLTISNGPFAYQPSDSQEYPLKTSYQIHIL